MDGAKLRKKIETDVLRTHKFVLMAHKMQENVENALSIKQFTHCYNFLENSAMSVVFQSKRCNKRQVDGLLE